MSDTLWATRPGWTRAHFAEHAGSMYGEQSWLTRCNRDYPLDDPLTDEPTPAPADMPRCTHCSDVLAGRRL